MLSPLQSLLRAGFMRVEAVFNRAFGDRLNPLYHLGAVTFFLFWIVAGSGLYLYVFFETAVSGAYQSVQAITHGQWFAGGVLRSVHRYASDAMVLTMMLHLLRHFAFDRFRGFRWFSWATGVLLIWLLYVSGINGYMLPWDQLAQFVTVASFEWLDSLPSFGGTLIRNFIYPESVSDRLFSLLAFLHIGAPLILLLLMWVHVQRVAKASTSPPRPIAIGLGVTMLVLALARPVMSQGGPADVTTAPGELALDWFYLAVYPLLYQWPLLGVWALVAGGTLALLSLPWWPQLRARRRGEFHMALHGDARVVSVRPGETLLEAGLRQGVALPYECRNGGCGVCRCTVLHGSVDHGSYQKSALPDAARKAGEALMCTATPLADVEIEVEGLETFHAETIREATARVERIERLAPEVMALSLSLPGEPPMAFTAGQYLNIVLDDGQRRAFSFANAPHAGDDIELHVRRIPGGRFTGHVFDALQIGDTLRIEGPLGGFTLRDSERPIVFVAGATGFAPVKSIIEDAIHRGVTRPMWLYWGVRSQSDLYQRELAEQWQRTQPDFHFVPVLSEAGADWRGRRGLVHEAMLADQPSLGGFEVYVCGSVRMVEAAVPAFLARGLGEDACFTDAFLPASPAR